jgi:hypothetical protein
MTSGGEAAGRHVLDALGVDSTIAGAPAELARLGGERLDRPDVVAAACVVEPLDSACAP